MKRLKEGDRLNNRQGTVFVNHFSRTRTIVLDVDAADPDEHGRVRVIRDYSMRRPVRRRRQKARKR